MNMTTVRVFLMKSCNTKVIALKQDGDNSKRIIVIKITLGFLETTGE